MTGAAGGLSGGLWAEFGGQARSRRRLRARAARPDRRLEDATAAVTGEGRLDSRASRGKLVGEVARRCRAGVPLHAIAGQVDLDEGAASRLGLASATEAGTLEAIEAAARELAE